MIWMTRTLDNCLTVIYDAWDDNKVIAINSKDAQCNTDECPLVFNKSNIETDADLYFL